MRRPARSPSGWTRLEKVGCVSRCETTARASMWRTPIADWGWEQCKTTLKPWVENARCTAIQAGARRLRLYCRSRKLARSIKRLRKKEATDGDAQRDLPLVP